MHKQSFTYAYYLNIIHTFHSSGRKFCSIADFFTQDERRATVILRHDVDRWPRQSIRLAHLEYKNGIRSTYYFRATSEGQFNRHAIQAIADLGHEVGYHYDTLAVCKGDRNKAFLLFEKNLENFREIASCTTVSMHGSPLSPYDNLELLKDIDLRNYGLIADATLSFSCLNMVYYTDTGGSWNTDDILNRRDRIQTAAEISPEDYHFGSDAFLDLLKNFSVTIYLNVHPERWAYSTLNLFICRFCDFGANVAKRYGVPVMRLLRSSHKRAYP